jgi:hypothetical protein
LLHILVLIVFSGHVFVLNLGSLWLRVALCLIGVGISAVVPFVVVDQPDKFLGVELESLYAGFRIELIDSANPNVVAGALAMIAPYVLASSMERGSMRAARVCQIASVVLMLGVVVILQSRGAILGTAFGCLLALGMWYSRAARILRYSPLVLVAAGLLMLFFDLSWVASIDSQVFKLRAVNWLCGRYLFEDFFYTGVGLGRFRDACLLLYPELAVEQNLPYAHSLLLQVGVDAGIGGMVSVVAVLLYAIDSAGRVAATALRDDQSDIRAVAIGLLSSVAAVLTHGLVDAIPWGTVKPAPIFWLIVGLAIGLGRYLEQSPVPPATQTAGPPTDTGATDGAALG